jgi:hypothetical protein
MRIIAVSGRIGRTEMGRIVRPRHIRDAVPTSSALRREPGLDAYAGTGAARGVSREPSSRCSGRGRGLALIAENLQRCGAEGYDAGGGGPGDAARPSLT